jgi:hypothetical protein
MRASSVIFSLSLAAALSGCSLETATPPPTGSGTTYTPLPERKTTVSGIVYDPDAFFVSLATFPFEDGPPPALFDGVPHVFRSAAFGATVSLTRDGTVADESSPAAPTGFWQSPGVPTGDATYLMRTVIPAEGIMVGGPPEAFPPELFGTIPTGQYFPTTTLRPIVPMAAACDLQVATVLGETGALGAVANLMTDMGTPKTPAALADPAQTGAVLLIWVASPSPVFDYFIAPAGGVAAELAEGGAGGSLYAINWAPPEVGIPGQSAMGYFATPDSVSDLGYFALVLPRGATGPVTVRFVDTNPPPPPPEEGEEPDPFANPWIIPEFSFDVGPGISFARVHALPSMPPPPEDPYADPKPEEDMSWMCLPPPPAEPPAEKP